MRYTAYILTIALIALSSCEDPIDVTLEDNTPEIVIDAFLDNRSIDQTIRVSRSIPYFETGQDAITTAQVSVIKESGQILEFLHTSDGEYVLALDGGETIGVPGEGYLLEVQIGDDLYTSAEIMADAPQIDSIVQFDREDELGFDDGTYAQFFARDIAGESNGYWIKTFKNDTLLNKPEEINLAFDGAFSGNGDADGLIFITPIRENINPVEDPVEAGEESEDVSPYDPGDRVRVEIHGLGLESFLYMSAVQDQLLNAFSTIFAEPLQNVRGNIVHSSTGEKVLGQFNVGVVTSLEVEIE